MKLRNREVSRGWFTTGFILLIVFLGTGIKGLLFFLGVCAFCAGLGFSLLRYMQNNSVSVDGDDDVVDGSRVRFIRLDRVKDTKQC